MCPCVLFTSPSLPTPMQTACLSYRYSLATILIVYVSLQPWGNITKSEELLIENRATGLQGHIHYQDGGQRVSVTKAAVCMGVEEMGM